MNKKSANFMVAIATTFLVACSPSSEQIMASADSLLIINKQIDSAFTVLNDSYETFQPTVMDAALESLNNYLNVMAEKTANAQPSKGCEKLQKAICNKIDVLKKIADNEAREQVRIYKIPDSNYTAELKTQWEDLARKVERKVENADSKVESAKSEIIDNLIKK